MMKDFKTISENGHIFHSVEEHRPSPAGEGPLFWERLPIDFSASCLTLYSCSSEEKPL
ncbi:hypothetical protein [Akkermansia sp.]|uniref:hypothetical protein n=1 Tax=Akkermansia sp. TaxID=1872421 RepID=UPI0025B8A5D6|nr:hypothetical protein [Akkermansia sp.]MCC8148706.1 hypothetical protein [Akkermansia sp.]